MRGLCQRLLDRGPRLGCCGLHLATGTKIRFDRFCICLAVRSPWGLAGDRHLPAGRNQSAVDVNAPPVADLSGRRFIIEDIYPCVDCGRFPVKRVAGESIDVWADIFRDGHEVMAAALLWRRDGELKWQRSPMRFHQNDRWIGHFTPPVPGRFSYAIGAWTDTFATWRRDFRLKRDAGQNVDVEAQEGRALLEAVRARKEAKETIAQARLGFDETGDAQTLLSDQLA